MAMRNGKQTLKRTALIILPFVLGLSLGATFSAAAQSENSLDEHVFGRAEAFLVSMHNIVISLSVDTERSAINIAELNKKISKLELRLEKLEGSEAAKK